LIGFNRLQSIKFPKQASLHWWFFINDDWLMKYSAVPHLKKHFYLFLLAIFIRVARSCLSLLIAVQITLFSVQVLPAEPIQNHLGVVVFSYHQFEFEYYNQLFWQTKYHINHGNKEKSLKY
jgi:hypothetical protein